MLLARLAELEKEVAADPTLSSEIKGCSVYYHHGDKWRAVSSREMAGDELERDLSRSLASSRIHQKGAEALYPIPEHKAVVHVKYDSAVRSKRRIRHAAQLKRCLDQARHRFDATHDILTGLLNGQEFAKRFGDLAANSQQSTPEVPPSAPASSSPSTQSVAALYAIDVDHFKQVNDNYGHLYGDLVLQVLAARLVATTNEIAGERPGLRFEVARPSGEEFLVGMSGSVNSVDLIVIGDRIRLSISSSALPSDREFQRHAGPDAGEPFQPPPLNERHVTVSVGTALVGQIPGAPETTALRTVRDRADRALYTAKAGGRNCVRLFDDILQRHGSVIEEHPDTGVVTIDIGRTVGVSVGQEFLVYHPQFTGAIPVIQDDGRSKRQLGTYPRFSSGRIVVFDVQPDIAFARCAEKNLTSRFPSGARLEAIPLGSISHLLPTAGLGMTIGGRAVMTIEELELSVKERRQGTPPRAIVFFLKNQESLVNDYGAVALNESLAKLYMSITNAVKTQTPVGQVGVNALAVAFTSEPEDDEDLNSLAEEIVGEASRACGGRAEFGAGVYDGRQTLETPWDNSELRLDDAVSYARLAAAAGRLANAVVTVLDEDALLQILVKARSNQQYSQAIADYAEYCRLGIDNPRLKHQAGLAASSLNDHQLARDYYMEAVKAVPEEHGERKWAHKNLALAFYRLEEFGKANEEFSKVPVKDLSDPYLMPAVNAAFGIVETSLPDADLERARELLDRAMAALNPEAHPKRAERLQKYQELLTGHDEF